MQAIINDIVHFNKVSGTIPCKEKEELYCKLIDEELQEYIKAVEENNATEKLDALADMIVVVIGAAYSSKLDHVLVEALERVYESNMTKFCTFEEAKQTVKKYKEENIDTVIVKKEDIYIVKRQLDGKILKNINYKPVKLSDLANRK